MELRLDKDGNPIVDQFFEEGFVDLVFRIVDLEDHENRYRFHLAASFDGGEVGFDVLLIKGIRGGFDGKMDLIQDHVYRDGIRFLRSGEESDRLISAIHQFYGASAQRKKWLLKSHLH